jgi:hypothetical protein
MTFSFAYIYDVADHNREFVLELLFTLKDNLEDLPPEMWEKFSVGAWEEVGKTAHKLKSSVLHAGHADFSEALIELDAKAKAYTLGPNDLNLMRLALRCAASMLASVEEEIERAKMLPQDS